MKTAIVYATTHGCTEACSQKLAARLTGQVDLFSLKDKKPIDLSHYDRVLIGGSIHAGKIQGQVRRFCADRMPALLEKRTGLFICCMEKGEKAMKQLEQVFPTELRNHASALGLFGGAFNFEKMNFIQKAVIRKIAKIDRSVSAIDEKAMDRFVETMAGKS